MFIGPFTPQVCRGCRVASVVCAGLVLAWLASAALDLPAPRLDAVSVAPPMVVWFPLVTAALLWSHWLRR